MNKLNCKITFKDGVEVTIRGYEDVEIHHLSENDIEFNNIANKALNGNVTEYIRLCCKINERLGVEVL